MSTGTELRARSAKKNAAAALDKIALDGTPVFAVRDLAYGGQRLKRGDSTHLTGGKFDGLLLEQGILVPLEAWERIQAEEAAARYEREVLKPIRQALAEAEGEKAAAAAALAAAIIRSDESEQALETARANFDRASKDRPELLGH